MTQRILIAEDEAAVARVLHETLSSRGHDVAWAPDGGTAVARARAETFDAVVLDIHMPGMNGVAVADLLRSRNPRMKIVLVSGMITESTKQAAAGLTGVTLLPKPVSAEALSAALAEPAPRAPAWDVLVVEDYPALRDLVSGYFYAEGWNVVAVSDGDAAVREARRRRAKAAVVDLNVPGPHGAELVRRMIEADPTLYVVMMTGEATHADVAAGYRAGARALIRKPFQTRELLKALKGRDREIEDHRKAAAERERVESLPGWKRAVHETRTFVDESRQGKHRTRIRTALTLAAALLIALAAGRALRAFQGVDGPTASRFDVAEEKPKDKPVIIVIDSKKDSRSESAYERAESRRASPSDEALGRTADLIGREARR